MQNFTGLRRFDVKSGGEKKKGLHELMRKFTFESFSSWSEREKIAFFLG